jgi:hypothetical protein
MYNGTGKWRLTRTVLLLSTCFFLARAQNVALFTSVKGVVNVKKSSGQVLRASAKDGLAPGDEVSTSSGSVAALMYYTGKEVTLAANKAYVIAKDAKEDTFLNRLASVFSNLLWSKEKSKSVLGASRGFEPTVNRSVNGIYPSYNVERGPVLLFEWNDNQPKPGTNYVVTLRNEKGDIEKSVTVSDANRVLLPIARMNLIAGGKYRWQVRDQKSSLASKELEFSLLSDADKAKLDEYRQRLKNVCKNDSTGFRYTLLEAMLCLDSNLMMEAESSLLNLVTLKPEFVVGHEMLVDVYRKVGKVEEAYTQQKVLQTLLEAK